MKPHHFEFVVKAGEYKRDSQLVTYVNPTVVFRPSFLSLYMPGPFQIDRKVYPFESAERWSCESVRIGVEEQFAGPGRIPFMSLVDAPPFKMSVAQPGIHITLTLRCISTYTQERDEAFYFHGYTP